MDNLEKYECCEKTIELKTSPVKGVAEMFCDISTTTTYYNHMIVLVGDITRALIGYYSPVMPTGRLRACARTIGCKVITFAAPALAFLLDFCCAI